MSEVTLEREGNVAFLTLRAPERRNAFTPGMVDELLGLCEQVDADRGIGCVVVRALGQAFCSGAYRDVLAHVDEGPTEAGRYERLGRG